ncbi:MAG: VWA domain-containing protein [Candidatus Yonathbacteria bacterium]|nr:VWA domain-containing protein [Candidatus Yonathbacteria bacterium]
MLTWASKRQLAYLFLVVGTIIVVSAYPIYRSFIYHEPSCFDGEKNQTEGGVDCGGSCKAVCSFSVTPLLVDWSRFFKVSDGTYDLAAYIENRNFSAGLKRIGYTFELYDNGSNLLATQKGDIFVNPGEQFVVYEPNTKVGDSVPTRVFFEFDKDPQWVKGTPTQQALSVKSRSLTDPYGSPHLQATIVNDSIDMLSNVNISAIVYNSSKNAIAASETTLDAIGKGEEKNIFFSWPTSLLSRPASGSCTAPTDTMLVFDRSGSMENDGKNPSQPLTNAKNAAGTFVDKIGSADKIGLISFATTASEPIDLPLSTDSSLAKKAIANISISKDSEASGYTNLGDAIEKAILELSSPHHESIAKRAMIILTDGDSNRPKSPNNPKDTTYPETYAITKAVEAKKAGISIYTIGLGKEVSEDYLKNKIASAPDYYYKAVTSDNLESIYKKIAQDVCKEETFTTDVVVHINSMIHSRTQ